MGLKASIYYELLLLFSDRYSNINIPGAVLKDKTVYEDKERSGYKETLAEINKLCDTALSPSKKMKVVPVRRNISVITPLSY